MIELLQHNIKPYERLCENLKTNKRVAFVSATGTGKSYVVAKYIEDNNLANKTVIFSPTTVIRDNWNKLLPLSQVGMYQTMHKADLDNVECIVCDEMHHLGSEIWGGNFRKYFKNFNGYIIGTTATDIRYLDGGRDMSKELFDNNKVVGWELSDAITQGILPALDYHKGRYTYPARMKQKRNEKTERLFRKLDLAMSRCSIDEMMSNYTGTKTVVFCPNINSLSEYHAIINRVFPDSLLFTVHSGLKKKERDEVIDSFKKCFTRSFLFAIDMLNEGLHVGGVDGVIMFRKTQSPTVFKQQIGRALSVGDKERVQVWDFVSNFNSITSILNIGEASVLNVINATIQNPDRQIMIDDQSIETTDLLERIQDACQNAWTNEEDDIIRANYVKLGPAKTCKLLNNRTYRATCARARFLKVNPRNWWTAEQTDLVKELYGKIPNKDLAKMVNHPVGTLSAYARSLGLRVFTVNFWEEDDEKELETLSKKLSVKELAEHFHRSRIAISHKLGSMGIEKSKKPKMWSEEEDKYLTENITDGIDKIADKLGRTKASVDARVTKLGLRKTAGPVKKWSEEEVALLYNPALTNKQIGEKIGRSTSSVRKKKQALGIKQEV